MIAFNPAAMDQLGKSGNADVSRMLEQIFQSQIGKFN